MCGLENIASSTVCNNPSFSYPKDEGSRFLRNAGTKLKATGRLYFHRHFSLSVKHHVENDKFIVFILQYHLFKTVNKLTLKSLLVKSTPRTNGNTPVLAIPIFLIVPFPYVMTHKHPSMQPSATAITR
jgi:hypothetical protein